MFRCFFENANCNTPSYSSARLWLLRIGHYKLTRPKTHADDWVWIVDHTIQIGVSKCFVILGVRLSALHGDYTLTHADVEPVAIVPMAVSNGAAVAKHLAKTVEITGKPRAIVSDGGSDLRSGIRTFCDENPGTAAVYDIHHKTAIELKRVLEADDSWQKFSAAANLFKRTVQQTQFAPLAPPSQRGKSRYMNLDVLTCWVRDVLMPAYRTPELAISTLHIDRILLAEKLAWVSDHAANIQRWDDLNSTVELCNTYIRRAGYGESAADTLATLWSPSCDDTVNVLRDTLLGFIRDESAKAHAGERLIACSDIIESVFGKFKHLEGEHALSGFTGSVLAIAAIVSTTTRQVVQNALEGTKVKDMLAWVEQKVGRTVQGERCQLRLATMNAAFQQDQM
jgi:hypothetical protein